MSFPVNALLGSPIKVCVKSGIPNQCTVGGSSNPRPSSQLLLLHFNSQTAKTGGTGPAPVAEQSQGSPCVSATPPLRQLMATQPRVLFLYHPSLPVSLLTTGSWTQRAGRQWGSCGAPMTSPSPAPPAPVPTAPPHRCVRGNSEGGLRVLTFAITPPFTFIQAPYLSLIKSYWHPRFSLPLHPHPPPERIVPVFTHWVTHILGGRLQGLTGILLGLMTLSGPKLFNLS